MNIHFSQRCLAEISNRSHIDSITSMWIEKYRVPLDICFPRFDKLSFHDTFVSNTWALTLNYCSSILDPSKRKSQQAKQSNISFFLLVINWNNGAQCLMRAIFHNVTNMEHFESNNSPHVYTWPKGAFVA